MNEYGLLLALLTLAAGGCDNPSPQPDVSASPKAEANAPQAVQKRANIHYASVVTAEDKHPMLVIDYPWQELSRPAVQIALYPHPHSEIRDQPPITVDSSQMAKRFSEEIARIKSLVEENEAAKNNGVFVETLLSYSNYSGKQMSLEFLICRDSLGKNMALASGPVRTGRMVESSKKNLSEEKQARKLPEFLYVAVCYAPKWCADDTNKLHLHLPSKQFFLKRRMAVWLLNEDRVVWRQDVAWPGTGKEQHRNSYDQLIQEIEAMEAMQEAFQKDMERYYKAPDDPPN